MSVPPGDEYRARLADRRATFATPVPAGRPVQHGPSRHFRRRRGAPHCVVAGVAGGALAGAAGRGLCRADPTPRPRRPRACRGATVHPVLRARPRAHRGPVGRHRRGRRPFSGRPSSLRQRPGHLRPRVAVRAAVARADAGRRRNARRMADAPCRAARSRAHGATPSPSSTPALDLREALSLAGIRRRARASTATAS